MAKTMKKLKKDVKHLKKRIKKDKKFEKVMKEYKEDKLHMGSKKGKKVKSRKQALAIAFSEAARAGKK